MKYATLIIFSSLLIGFQLCNIQVCGRITKRGLPNNNVIVEQSDEVENQVDFSGEALENVEVAEEEIEGTEEDYCPSHRCGILEKTVDQWDCAARYLTNYDVKTLGELQSREEELSIEVFDEFMNRTFTQLVSHTCNLGWGNNIRGLANSISLSLSLGRKLHIADSTFQRMFSFSSNKVVDDFFPANYVSNISNREFFDFEKHGRSPGRYENFVSNLYYNESFANPYKKTILVSGVCALESEFVTRSECLLDTIPSFMTCLRDSTLPLSGPLLSVPFFYMTFRKPSSLAVNIINNIRDRVDLPHVEWPHSVAKSHLDLNKIDVRHMGLRTFGYYIFTLHFRNFPIGFERHSEEFNMEGSDVLNRRRNLLQSFLQLAAGAVVKAKLLSQCRGEKLVIYFASDDVSLRKIIKSMFSMYGKVVFGIEENEVGHSTRQFASEDENLVKNRGNFAIAEW